MHLKQYFMLIGKSLYPDKHKELIRMPFFRLLKYFMFLVLVSMLVSIIILLPMIATYKSTLSEQLAHFDTFQLSIDVESSEPTTILEKPLIVVDFDKQEATEEWMLINKKELMYKKYLFFGKEKAIFSNYKSVKADESVSLYSKLMIFLLPAFFFWVVVFFLIKYSILVLIFSTLGWIFFASGRHQITWQKAVKVAIFSATPMVILDLALWPILIMYYIPILIYLVYFIVGMLMVSDRKYGHKGGHKHGGHDFKPRRKQDDFLPDQHEE